MFRIRLKELRENANMSQKALADKFSISQGTVGNWESGTREPSFDTAKKIAEFFEVTVDYLLGRTDDPSSANIKPDEELLRAQISTFGDPREYSEEELSEIKTFLRFVKQKREEK